VQCSKHPAEVVLDTYWNGQGEGFDSVKLEGEVNNVGAKVATDCGDFDVGGANDENDVKPRVVLRFAR
jgi:hypothetical protein